MSRADALLEFRLLADLARRQETNPYNKERHTRVIFGEMADRLEAAVLAMSEKPRRSLERVTKKPGRTKLSRRG